VAKHWNLLLTGGHKVSISNTQKAYIISELSTVLSQVKTLSHNGDNPDVAHKILHVRADENFAMDFPELHLMTDTFVAVQSAHDNPSPA